MKDDIQPIEYNFRGGTSGLEYEEGTYQPTADVTMPTIPFANTHDEPPFLVALFDVEGTYNSGTNTISAFLYFDLTKLWNMGIITGATALRYGFTLSMRSTTFSTRAFTDPYEPGATGASAQASFVTETGFKPSRLGSSGNFYAGHTYKWIAIWR